jgi:hypothetical protein
MVKKGFLPIWIFKSASGPSVVRLFYLVKPYIEERRKTSNHYYAKDFEYLVRHIERKYKIFYTAPSILPASKEPIHNESINT